MQCRPFNALLTKYSLHLCYTYMDNVLVATTQEEHLQHLWPVLERLSGYNVVIILKNISSVSAISVPSVTLIHKASLHFKIIQVIQNFPQPTSQRKLREFMCLVNFYHRFLPHCAKLMWPLHALLANKMQTVSLEKFSPPHHIFLLLIQLTMPLSLKLTWSRFDHLYLALHTDIAMWMMPCQLAPMSLFVLMEYANAFNHHTIYSLNPVVTCTDNHFTIDIQ